MKVSKDGQRIIGRVIRDNIKLRNVKVDIDDLRLLGYKCYATFAGEKSELIVLLNELDSSDDQ